MMFVPLMTTEEERGDRGRKCFILNKHTPVLYKISPQIRNILIIKAQSLKLLFKMNKWETNKKIYDASPILLLNIILLYVTARDKILLIRGSLSILGSYLLSASSIYSSRSSMSLRNWHQQKKVKMKTCLV